MRTAFIMYLVAILLTISFVLCAVSGFIFNFLGPSPLLYLFGPGARLTFFHTIITGVAVTILAVLHIILHRKWLISMTKKYSKKGKTEKPK